jgi:hypothetical protein
VPSYNLLSKLLLRHRSYNHSSFLLELLSIITLTNISNITRTRQTEHIKDKTKVIIIAEVFQEVSKAIITSEAVTVFKVVKIITNIIY